MRLVIRVEKQLLDHLVRVMGIADPAEAIIECAKNEVGRVERVEGELPTVLSPAGVANTDPQSDWAEYQPADAVEVPIDADENLLIKSMYAAMVPTFHHALIVLMRISVYDATQAEHEQSDWDLPTIH